MLTIQCKMQENHTTACAQDTYPLTAEEAKVKSLSVSVLKLFPHSSKTCKTKTIIKHFLMRKALVPLTTGYCQSTVTCKTRLSCLDFASWLSHQLHHRQPLMKKVIESPGRELKCKDIRQVLDGLKYSIQTTVTLCFKNKVSSQFPTVLTSTLECFSTISESCFRSSSKYWKLQIKKGHNIIHKQKTQNTGLNIYKPFPISAVHTPPDQSTEEVTPGL